MRHILSLGVFFALICLSSESFAQPPARPYTPRESFAQPPARPYTPASESPQPPVRAYTPDVITVSGVVVEGEEIYPERKMGAGKVILLATSEGQFIVHLGPERYLEQIGLRIALNDFLKVTGKLVRQPTMTSIIASEVEKDSNVFKLREEGDFPLWEEQVRY